MNNLIGNTPLIKIRYKYDNKIRNVYTKLEFYNLTGSIKDRMAYYIINEAYKNNLITKKQPIIEATSGNTGISLAAIGAYFDNPVYIFMPDWVSEERKKIMELYGAKVYLISKAEGGFLECIKKADELAKQINGFRPNQFNNQLNAEINYNTTAQEIINKKLSILAFISGIGTGGTLMGIGKKLKENYKNIKIIAIEPEKLPIISKKNIDLKQNHKIEGIGDEFIPQLLDENIIDELILIDDEDAINMSTLLAKKLGLGVGISSGANFLGAVLSGIDNVMTIFSDDLKKYISIKRNTVNINNLISSKVELLDFEIV